MNTKPYISIVTVAFNSAATIGRTLESLRLQTDKRFESIVIDGSSKDGTMEIVKSYSDVVSKSISEPDKGIYDAMNKGIALAEGKYIAFLNSDDAYFTDTVSSVIAFAERHNPEIIYGDMQKQRALGKELLTRNEKPNLHRMLETMGVFHPATFTKKEAFDRWGGFDLRFKLASDYHWLLRAYIEKVDFQYLDKILVKFSVGGVSNFSCESYRECIQIQEELNTGTSQNMHKLYGLCRKKMRKQRIIAKFVSLPFIRTLYLQQIKKRWN